MTSDMSVGGGKSGPVAVLRGVLEERLRGAGIRFPAHNLLAGVMINAMFLLVTSGEQARFSGTDIVKNVLAVSDDVMSLSSVLGIDVRFRFDNILAVPLSTLVDGNIIGFGLPRLYFKNKPVPEEELRRAQVLFNFLDIVRYYIVELGTGRIAEFVEDLNNAIGTELLIDPCQSSQTSRADGTDACRIGGEGPQGRLALGLRDMNVDTGSRAGVTVDKSLDTSVDCIRSLKRPLLRPVVDENAPPGQAQGSTRERRKREGRFFAGGSYMHTFASPDWSHL